MTSAIGFGRPNGYQQLGSWAANALTAASWASTSGGQVTFTTTTAHGVVVGQSFLISGMTPAAYNGSFVAIAGTTGSTLVAALATNPGAETVLGTLGASLQASTGLPGVPAGTTSAVISCSGAAVRFRDDGVAPTASLGFAVGPGVPFMYVGNANNLLFIQETSAATLDILYYK